MKFRIMYKVKGRWMVKVLIVLFTIHCSLFTASAQTVRNITVSAKDSYTDHISMEQDANDKDMMVKFVFDEAANQLTVSLISYRNLFVFREDVRYKPAIKGRTIRPDMLPYVVTYDPSETYKLSKLFKSTVPSPRKKYVFSRWIQYENLQPAPQEYSMVNDFISQTFDIVNKKSNVTVTLRDVMLLDDVSKKPNKKCYEIPYGRDLFLKYQITIQRNPCFGLDEDIAAAQNALQAVSKAHASIRDKFGSGKVSSQASQSVFDEMKKLLLEQYPRKSIQSPCPDIQNAWDTYNQHVDSISAMRVVVESAGGGSAGGEGVNAKTLLTKARQIDVAVSRWLMSGDAVERRDIVSQCESIIQSVNAAVKEQGLYTAEQQKAMKVFREAVAYYHSKCQ